MVTLTVFSILAAAAAGAFNTSQTSLHWNYQALTLQEELRRSLSNMTREIRESSPSSPNPLASAAVTPGTNSFSFEIPATVSANVVTAWTRVHYFLCADSTVGRVVSPNPLPANYVCPIANQTTIGSTVTTMNFTYNAGAAPRTVRIQITGTRTAATTNLDRNITVTVTGEVTLRN